MKETEQEIKYHVQTTNLIGAQQLLQSVHPVPQTSLNQRGNICHAVGLRRKVMNTAVVDDKPTRSIASPNDK